MLIQFGEAEIAVYFRTFERIGTFGEGDALHLVCTPFILEADADASSSIVLQAIQNYLGVDWEELTGNALTKSPAPVDMTMIMTVPDTDYRIRGVLSTVSIPEHILE